MISTVIEGHIWPLFAKIYIARLFINININIKFKKDWALIKQKKIMLKF